MKQIHLSLMGKMSKLYKKFKQKYAVKKCPNFKPFGIYIHCTQEIKPKENPFLQYLNIKKTKENKFLQYLNIKNPKKTNSYSI